MKSLALVLSALCLCVASGANAATDEARFLSRLKSYGITIPPGSKSKKPCLCVGGTADRGVGGLVVFKPPPGASWVYDCVVLGFNDDERLSTTTSCSDGGGSVVLINE